MPLDTRIALGAQPLQLENQLAQYGQAVGIQNAMQQNQLGQMQMSAAQRTMQEEEGAKNFLSTNPDLSNVENQRRLLAFGKTGLAYGKAFLDQRKASQDSDKTAAEILGLNQKNFTAFNPPMRAAANGIPGITAYVEAMYADPVLGALARKIKTKEQALQENIAIFTKDPDQWVTAHASLEGSQLLDALKRNAEKVAEDARIASLPPLPGAVPTGTANDTRAAMAAPGAAAAPVGIDQSKGVVVYPIKSGGGSAEGTINIAPDVRINAKFQSQIVDKLKNYGETASLKEFPGMRWTLSPGGLLIRESIPAESAPLNAMATPAAVPVNALAGNEATLQAINAERKTLTDRLNVLERMRPSPGRDDEIKRREARLKEISAPINLRADGTSIIPGSGTLTAAAAPSDILRLQREEAALRASGDIAGANVIANRVKKLNELTDNRTAAQKEQAILDDPNATAAQKATATSQLAKLNQLTDNRTETQKEFAVLADPNASKEAKEAATKRIAKLVDIPAKSVDGAIERYEYAKKNSGYKGSFTDFIVLSTPKTTITNTMKTEGAYGTALAGKIADEDAALRVSAKKAPNLADNANRVLSILDKGDVFVGPAATIKLNIARVLNAAGANNDEKIANTETLISSLGRNTLGMVKESGLGTAQGFTDKDLQFLERVAGGSIDYNAQTLRNLTELAHKAAEASAEAWNKRVTEIPASAVGGTNISIEPVVVPARVTKAAAAVRPAGVPAEWTLKIDAAGKKAYVSPDGKSFKEVP